MMIRTKNSHLFRPRGAHASGGFTLVELLVVVGIITMILGLSVPVFAIIAQGRSIRGAVDVTQGVFLKYREKATTAGRPVFVVFEHWERPARFVAWYVEPDPAQPNQFLFRRDADVAVLPETVRADADWQSQVNYNLPMGIAFRAEAEAMATATGANTPNYNFTNAQGPHQGRGYFFIFTPEGSVLIVGRANIPSFAVDNADDGDIVLTNDETRMCIDINPATGRVRWGSRDFVN